MGRKYKVEWFDPKYSNPLRPFKQHQIFTARKDALQFKSQLKLKGRTVKLSRSKRR